MNKTDPIGALQQARTKVSVNLCGGPDDLLGEVFMQ
jgi:hypothetical protein